MNIIINVVHNITKDLFRILTHYDYDFTYTRSNQEFCIKNIYRFNSSQNDDKFRIWTKGLTPVEIDKENIISFEITKSED